MEENMKKNWKRWNVTEFIQNICHVFTVKYQFKKHINYIIVWLHISASFEDLRIKINVVQREKHFNQPAALFSV